MFKGKNKPPVRFRLTLAGWLFLAVTMLVGVSAINGQTSMLFALFGALLGALQISAVMARRMVAGVDLQRDVPERVWQNQTVQLGYYLRNTRKRGAGLGLCLQEEAPTSVQCTLGYCMHLPAGGVFRAGGRFVARQRGRVHFGRVRVSTAFPFGLVLAYRTLEQGGDLVVWPARGRIKAQLLRQGAAITSRGEPSAVTGGQDEFFGLREYRKDDNPRWIHWRRSANRATPVVREMARPLPEILWVMLDGACEGDSATAEAVRERKLRFAATLIDHAFGRGYQVGLCLGAGGGVLSLPPAGGRGQWRELLDALADVHDGPPVAFERILAAAEARTLRESAVILISSGAGPGAGGGIRAACRSLTVIDPGQIDRIFSDDPLTKTPEASA